MYRMHIQYASGKGASRLKNLSHFTDKKVDEPEPEPEIRGKGYVKGVGLERMGDKLDKLLVRPLKKPKNIKFKT